MPVGARAKGKGNKRRKRGQGRGVEWRRRSVVVMRPVDI